MPRVAELEGEVVSVEAELERYRQGFRDIADILDEMPPVYEMARRIRDVIG